MNRSMNFKTVGGRVDLGIIEGGILMFYNEKIYKSIKN
jgi:hypothetical protein